MISRQHQVAGNTKIDLSTLLVAQEDILLQKYPQGYLLCVFETSQAFEIDEIGAFLVEKLHEPIELRFLVEQAAQEFKQPVSAIESDIVSFVQDCVDLQVVRIASMPHMGNPINRSSSSRPQEQSGVGREGCLLCVKETLASGRDVVQTFAADGSPQQCWDESQLPDKWVNDIHWLSAGVAIGKLQDPNASPNTLPVLLDGDPLQCASWLAQTYRYIGPLLGVHSCVFGSTQLFKKQVLTECAKLTRVNHIVEVGGVDLANFLHRELRCTVSAVDPTFTTQNGGEASRLKIRRGLAENLPFESGAIDCVVCMFVLEHLVDPMRAMAEFSRVLRPDGFLLLGIPVDKTESGKPPLFHRWRFVESSQRVSSRSLPVTILFSAICPDKKDGNSFVRLIDQTEDACLFLINKGDMRA